MLASTNNNILPRLAKEYFSIPKVRSEHHQTACSHSMTQQWDRGGFCLEETMTGGACVGKIIDSNSRYYDIYY